MTIVDTLLIFASFSVGDRIGYSQRHKVKNRTANHTNNSKRAKPHALEEA